MESVKIFIPNHPAFLKSIAFIFHFIMIPKPCNLVCISFLILVLFSDYGTSLITTGQNSSNNFNMMKIGYSDAIGTHNILEGDIPKLDRSGIISPNARWPDNTVIYEYDPNFPADFRATFSKAMKHITGRTCVTFQERMSQNDYVFVTHGTSCSSSIGKRGGQQILSLGPQCSDLPTHIRHLVHVIGFGYEHNRADRDQYITVNLLNVDPINQNNFATYPTAAYSPFSVPYDYGSITHYGRKVYSINGQDTIIPLQVGAIIGEAKGLSDLDIKKINNMYCNGALGMMIRSSYDGSYLDVKGGISGEGKEVILTKYNHGNQDSQTWTANWVDLSNPNMGATFANWAQDGGRLKVLDEDGSSGLIATWGFASGYRNQKWIIVDVPVPVGSVQKRYLIKNLSTNRCLSAPVTRCSGLNLLEFFFKKLVYNNCKGGQARAVDCKSTDSKQLWNFDFV